MKQPAPFWNTAALSLATLVISAAGGFVADRLGVPAGWLMGGAVSVTIASMLGFPAMVPNFVRDIAFVCIGMSMGASVAPDSLALIPRWPVSILGLVIELALVISITGWTLTKVFKLDNGTAYLSSFPGHLSLIMGIASAGVGDPRQIAIIQIIRILTLTVCVPVGTIFLPIEHFPTHASTSIIDLQALLFLAAGCIAAGLVFAKLKIPAGFVLGAMALATAAKLGGLFTGSLPQPLVLMTFVMTGALIGSRFAGVTRTELVRAALGGLLATGLTVGIVTAIAYGVSRLVDLPFGQIWLGLAPGALEGMGALGVALGYDTAFIAAHHVIRLLLLSLAIPSVVLLIRARDKRIGAVL